MATEARSRIISSAIALGRRNGLANLAIADILADSGTARRSLYTHFPRGVADVAVEATKDAAALLGQLFDLGARMEPRAGLAMFVEGWKGWLESDGFSLGCPIVSAAMAKNALPEAAAIAEEAFVDWESKIRANLLEHGVPEDKARSLAMFMVSSVEGATFRCMSSSSAEPLLATQKHLEELLDLHLPRK
ncbi:MAG: TetR/AcrR family transcriptional regulator [Nocardiaceae bacterium]|nr:TetR/AcrR family transcriptional regulator [Nocardiaceae bacterium]